MEYDVSDSKETFAYFGRAVYYCQILEHGIVNAMLIARLHDRTITRTDIDAFMDKQFENTLGKLIRNLRAEMPLPVDLEDLLGRALKTRNWLCHDYFRERAVEFLTPGGRLLMIGELETAQQLMADADKSLDSVAKPIAAKFGITEEKFKEACDAMMKEHGISSQ
jgi:hypothetical protein